MARVFAAVSVACVALLAVLVPASGAKDPQFCRHLKPKLIDTVTISYPMSSDVRAKEVFNLQHRYSLTFTSALKWNSTGSAADPFTAALLIWNGTRADLASISFARSRVSDTVHQYQMSWHNTKFDKSGNDYVEVYPPGAAPLFDTPSSGSCYGGDPVSYGLASPEGRGLHFQPGSSASQVTGTLTIQIYDEEPGVEDNEPSSPNIPAPATKPSTPSGPSTGTTSSLDQAVVGKRYAVTASGRKGVTGGPKFTSAQGTYVLKSVALRLSSSFTYTEARTGSNLTGAATVTLIIEKITGSGPPSASVPLTYQVATAAKWTPDKAAREWAFTATLVKPDIQGCENVRFTAGKLKSSYLSFTGCGISVFVRPASVSIS